MSLSVRPHPITTHGKTINIYLLVNFRTDSWRRPWGGHRAFTFLVIGWPTFPPSSAWWAQATQLASAHWSFSCSHPLGYGFLLSSSRSRPSSLEVWTSSPISSTYSTSTRRRSSRHPLEEEHSLPAPGHSTTSTSRHACSTSSPC